jgi:alpha-galactosidase
MNVRKVMHGKINESTAINTLKEKEKDEMKRQAEMYKSNIECRNKISEKKISKTTTPCFRDSEKVCVGKLGKTSKTTTPYTKPLLSRESAYDKCIVKARNKEQQEYLEFIKNKFKENKISRKVLDHAVLLVKKCMKENFYLPTRLKTSLYRIFTCEKYELSGCEKKFFLYFKCALSKTHKYSIYKQLNR